MEVLRIKAAVRARDGNRCVACGMTQAEHIDAVGVDLDVHRIVPGSEYSTAPGVCETLCKTCHGPKPRRPRGTYPNGRFVTVDEHSVRQVKEVAAVLRGPLGRLPSQVAVLREAVRRLHAAICAPKDG